MSTIRFQLADKSDENNMSVHLLTCKCGQKIKVEPRQAGSELICQCGQTMNAPSMREIRALPLSGESGESDRFRKKWSFKNGAFFAVGGLVLLISLATAGTLGYLRSRIDVTEPKVDKVRLQASNDQIDEMPAIDLVQTFFMLEETGIDYYGQSPYLENVRIARNFQIGFFVAVGFCLLGIGAVVYSLVSK